MDGKQALSKSHNSGTDIIPAFLAPDYIVNNEVNNQITNEQAQVNAYPPLVLHDSEISEMVIRERLHHAIEMQHIDLFMQPLVTLPQRHLAFYEFFGRLRIKPGLYIPAKDYIELANEEHIISGLDTLLLTHCLKILKKQQNRVSRLVSYFINIKPFTLRNKEFMDNLVFLLSRHKKVAHTLIFEMHHNDFLLLSPAEKKILNELAKVGCRFSIDHAREIPSDLEQLRELNVRFVKINAQTLINNGKTEQGYREILSQKQNLESYNINLIVEKIENDNDLLELLDYDIKYGQGFLFGRPDFSGVYTTHPQ